MTVTVYTNPGIGDAYWSLMKILPYEDVHLKVIKAKPFRSEFLGHIQGVLSVSEFDMSHPALIQKAASLYNTYATEGIKPEMYLDVNTWIETGSRIEKYLPNLDTVWRFPWKLSRQGYKRARDYLDPKKKNIVIYTSSHNNNSGGSASPWNSQKWVELIEDLYKQFSDINVIWIGAKYDTDILPLIKSPMKVVTAESPDVVLQLLDNCACFISYQSGLSVLSTCNLIPTYMLYFNKLDKLRKSWCPNNSIHDEALYKPVLFGEVAKNLPSILQWVGERLKAY